VCSAQSGLCLSQASGPAASLQQAAFSGAANQTWIITPHKGGDGYYYACSSQVGGLCAAEAGVAPGNVQSDAFHDVSAQQWRIDPVL